LASWSSASCLPERGCGQEDAPPPTATTVRGVLREAAIADYGVVLTGRLDDDVVSCDAAATDAACATRPALAEAVFDRGPGRAPLCGGAGYADGEVVGS
jgi:hypothetical protein